MVTDDGLMRACAMAGPPGSGSHRSALRLYRRACSEWRERDEAIRQAEAERAVFLVLHHTATLTWAAMMRERPWRAAA